MARISYGEQLAIAPQCSFAPGYALAVVIPARRFKVVAGQQPPSTLGAKTLQTISFKRHSAEGAFQVGQIDHCWQNFLLASVDTRLINRVPSRMPGGSTQQSITIELARPRIAALGSYPRKSPNFPEG